MSDPTQPPAEDPGCDPGDELFVAERDASAKLDPDLVDLAGLADLMEARESEAQEAKETRPLAADDLGPNLVCADLSGCNLRGIRLAGRDLTGVNLAGADLSGADLRGAILRGASLRGADLTAAQLANCDLHEVKGEKAVLRGANLAGAILTRASFDRADMLEVDLTHADANHSSFIAVNFSRSRLEWADFSRSKLMGAKLYGCRVAHARLERSEMRGAHLSGMTGYEKANWTNCDLRDIDLHGTYMARRFIADQNYLYEFRSRGKSSELIYQLWWLTSDCGRSAIRWSLMTALLMVGFAKLYTFVEVDYGGHETWLSPLYYSVVTLTTLGYGDVLPASVGAQVLAMFEVCVGYVMLGGLLSIFSNRMARRA